MKIKLKIRMKKMKIKIKTRRKTKVRIKITITEIINTIKSKKKKIFLQRPIVKKIKLTCNIQCLNLFFKCWEQNQKK